MGQKIENELELESRKWANRRKIALRSLWSGIVILFIVLFAAIGDNEFATRLSNISDILSWGIMGLFSLAGAYMGLSTWADKKK